MKFIDNSLNLAYSLFNSAYTNKKGYQCFHFAFLYDKNRLISIGQNDSSQPSSKAIKFANRFGCVEHYRKHFLHAEISAISRVWGRFYIDNRVKLVVIRLNKHGQLCESKPCSNCQVVLDALNITKVWYSTKDRGVVNE